MTSRTRVLAGALTAALAVGGCAVPIHSAAAKGLSTANLKGRYGLAWYGIDALVPAGFGEIAVDGVLAFNGKGGITGGSISYNDDGTVCESSVATTPAPHYIVQRDGEGEFNFSITPAMGFTCSYLHFEFPIALSALGSNGIAARVSIGEGGVPRPLPLLSGSGLALLQSASPLRLSTANVVGNYSFAWFGHDLSSTGNPYGFGASGEIRFNRSGAVVGGSIAYNDGGAICAAGPSTGGSLSGTSIVKSDGEGHVNLIITSPLGNCPWSSFGMLTAVSALGPGNIATRLQFFSDRATSPAGAGSSGVVVSGLAIKQ